MIDALVEVTELSQAALWDGFLVFLRVGAVMALLPAFGEQTVPQRVRIVLAFAFTLIVAPAVVGTLPEQPVSSLRLIGSEVANGLMLGFFLRFYIMALQIAGTIAAQSTSLSQMFSSAGVEPMPAIGHLLMISGLALAVMTGLHVQVAKLIIATYEVLPTGRMPAPSAMAQAGIGQISYIFALSFTLAAPFVVASVLYNVALGVINRAMPQLMVTFVGAPVITAGSLLLLFLIAPVLLAVWREALDGFFQNPLVSRR